MSHRLTLAGGLLLWGSLALAQDRPHPPPPAKPRPPAPARHPDVQFALDDAAEARARARCLVRAAQQLEAAAHRAAARPDDAERFGAVDEARFAIGACDAPRSIGTPRVARSGPKPKGITLDTIHVGWAACQQGDPMCSDIGARDAAPIVRTLRQRQQTLTQCLARPGAQGAVRLLLGLKEIDGRARPSVVKVVEDTVKQPAAVRCLEKRAAQLVFPEAARGARVGFVVHTTRSD